MPCIVCTSKINANEMDWIGNNKVTFESNFVALFIAFGFRFANYSSIVYAVTQNAERRRTNKQARETKRNKRDIEVKR